MTILSSCDVSSSMAKKIARMAITCAQLPTSQCDQLNIHLRGELSLGLHRAMNGCMNVRAETDDKGNYLRKGKKVLR